MLNSFKIHYVQHISLGWKNNFIGGIRPPAPLVMGLAPPQGRIQNGAIGDIPPKT